MAFINRYVVAVDDTGNNAPLLQRDLSPAKPQQQHISGIGALILREDQVDSFENEWHDMRCRLQQDLGLSMPPPIHLRLMYGRNLPKHVRGGQPNPYYIDATTDAGRREIERRFPLIIERLDEAAELFAKYTRRHKAAGHIALISTRQVLVDRMHQAYSQPAARADLKRLRSENPRAFREFFHALTTPLLPRIASLWLTVNEAMEILKAESARFRFDRFTGTEHLSTTAAHDIMRNIGGLQKLEPNALCIDYDSDALLQAADLLLYFLQRDTGGSEDPIARRILTKDARQLTVAKPVQLEQRAEKQRPYSKLGMIYGVARYAAEVVAPDYVNANLKDPAALIQEFRKHPSIGYVSMFKQGP